MRATIRRKDKRTMSPKARAEQDYWYYWFKQYWLSHWGSCPELTEGDRQEFFEYDSRGGSKPEKNPILLGKVFHGMQRGIYWNSYFDRDHGGWPGGLYLVDDYLLFCPYRWRPLYEFFGADMVDEWISALLNQFHYPPRRDTP